MISSSRLFRACFITIPLCSKVANTAASACKTKELKARWAAWLFRLFLFPAAPSLSPNTWLFQCSSFITITDLQTRREIHRAQCQNTRSLQLQSSRGKQMVAKAPSTQAGVQQHTAVQSRPIHATDRKAGCSQTSQNHNARLNQVLPFYFFLLSKCTTQILQISQNYFFFFPSIFADLKKTRQNFKVDSKYIIHTCSCVF